MLSDYIVLLQDKFNVKRKVILRISKGAGWDDTNYNKLNTSLSKTCLSGQIPLTKNNQIA